MSILPCSPFFSHPSLRLSRSKESRKCEKSRLLANQQFDEYSQRSQIGFCRFSTGEVYSFHRFRVRTYRETLFYRISILKRIPQQRTNQSKRKDFKDRLLRHRSSRRSHLRACTLRASRYIILSTICYVPRILRLSLYAISHKMTRDERCAIFYQTCRTILQ